MSSTKRRCKILRVGDKETPRNSPLDFATPIALLSPSTTNKKMSGEKGQPCLNPFSAEKKFEEDPFIRKKKRHSRNAAHDPICKANFKPQMS
jgi:hypothetical protein